MHTHDAAKIRTLGSLHPEDRPSRFVVVGVETISLCKCAIFFARVVDLLIEVLIVTGTCCVVANIGLVTDSEACPTASDQGESGDGKEMHFAQV